MAKQAQGPQLKLGRTLLRLGIVAFVFYFGVQFVVTGLQIKEKQQTLQGLRQACEEQELVNSELESMLSAGNNDEYIERIAREKLGLAYAEERVFIDVSGN